MRDAEGNLLYVGGDGEFTPHKTGQAYRDGKALFMAPDNAQDNGRRRAIDKTNICLPRRVPGARSRRSDHAAHRQPLRAGSRSTRLAGCASGRTAATRRCMATRGDRRTRAPGPRSDGVRPVLSRPTGGGGRAAPGCSRRLLRPGPGIPRRSRTPVAGTGGARTVVKWSHQARRDLRRIVDYIAQDSPHYARKVTQEIAARTGVLNELPRIGKMMPEVGDDDIRELYPRPALCPRPARRPRTAGR